MPVAEEPLGYDHESGFEGDMTIEYTVEHVESGTDVTIACRVQDDLGGEGMQAMKLKVE